jgi:hypothetical protein
MIAAFIFYIHIVGAIYAFAGGFVRDKLSDAFIMVAFVAIIFTVGWTIAGFIVKFFFPPGGFGPWLDPDTISLIIVSILEAILYLTYFYQKRNKRHPAAA